MPAAEVAAETTAAASDMQLDASNALLLFGAANVPAPSACDDIGTSHHVAAPVGGAGKRGRPLYEIPGLTCAPKVAALSRWHEWNWPPSPEEASLGAHGTHAGAPAASAVSPAAAHGADWRHRPEPQGGPDLTAFAGFHLGDERALQQTVLWIDENPPDHALRSKLSEIAASGWRVLFYRSVVEALCQWAQTAELAAHMRCVLVATPQLCDDVCISCGCVRARARINTRVRSL
jgi:hypothetical protein